MAAFVVCSYIETKEFALDAKCEEFLRPRRRWIYVAGAKILHNKADEVNYFVSSRNLRTFSLVRA